MTDKWADRTWHPYGTRDPYYAVCTETRFRLARLDEDAREAFFRSGEAHARWVTELVRRHVDPAFRPRRVLDFGCGVARVLVALARECDEAVGCDVSPGMLAEAARNCAAHGLENVTLVQSDETLRHLTGTFDFVHSFIVFQHIPPPTGESLVRHILGRITPGGVGALHFTYARSAPWWRKAVHRLRRTVPGVNAAVNLAQGAPVSEPLIPMYEYSLDHLLELLRARGCGEVHAALTDHGNHRGAMLLFRTPPGPRAG